MAVSDGIIFETKRDIGRMRQFIVPTFHLTYTITRTPLNFFLQNFSTNCRVPQLLDGAKILARRKAQLFE